MQLSAIRDRVQPVLYQDFDAVYEEYVLEVGHGRLLPFVDHLLTHKLVPQSAAASLLGLAPDEEPTEEHAVAHAPPPVPDSLLTTTVTPLPMARAITSPAVARTPPRAEEHKPTQASVAETEPPDTGKTAPDVTHSAPENTPFDLGAETVVLPSREALERAEEAADISTKQTIERPSPFRSDAMAKTVELNVAEALKSFDDLSDADWEDVPEKADDDAPKRTMFRKLTGGEIRETGRFGEEPEAKPRRRRRRRIPKSEGRYHFNGVVGEGAMGRVLLAKDGVLHRNVAYKAMSDDLREQPTLASKFSSEAQITAQLDHPNVVPVYSLESDTVYTMKLIEGKTLEALLDEVRALVDAGRTVPESLGLQQRLEWFVRVCEAVSYAHSRGVIHRDLKPENVMVGQWGEVYVMDWGIAKVFDGAVKNPVDLPNAPDDDEGELIIGTAGYMSPEQAEGWNDTLAGPSDQYALGLILFELVSLNPAVTGKAALKVVMRHQDGEKDPLVHRAKGKLSKELVAIVHKATHKAIEHRYKNVSVLADDVRKYLRGEPVSARPDGPLGALLRWMGTHRELTLMVVLVAVLGSAILVTAVAGYGQVRIAQAQAREQRITNLVTAAAKQTSQIDGQILKVEGLLSVVSTAASETLQRDVVGSTPIFRNEDFTRPATAPPDAETPSRGDKYGTGLVSTTTPVFVAPPPQTIDDQLVEDDRLLRLANMGRHFQRVLLRSHSERRAATNRSLARRTLMEVDIPVSWAFVALDDGALVSFPGHGGWSVDTQALQAPWYLAAQDEQAPVWGRVSNHPVTNTPVLTVSQALLDISDRTVGVAGLHLSMPRIVELLVPPSLQGVAGVEAFVLDSKGQIVLRSRPGATVNDLGGPFPIPSVREAAASHNSNIETIDDTLVVYNRMASNDWTYVLQGPVETLLK